MVTADELKWLCYRDNVGGLWFRPEKGTKKHRYFAKEGVFDGDHPSISVRLWDQEEDKHVSVRFDLTEFKKGTEGLEEVLYPTDDQMERERKQEGPDPSSLVHDEDRFLRPLEKDSRRRGRSSSAERRKPR